MAEQPVTSTAAGPGGKNIVLFSDGTGNSSAKLFKTNVWRMYEAIDLGPSPPEEQDQVAYYDDGIGTSSFRPLALLGGIFGVGLKRNVIDIYSYVCRNYTPGANQKPGPNPEGLGDHLYGFGFSRGAFTMRIAISILATEGVVHYVNERDLARKAADAYRHFCELSLPRRLGARQLAWVLRRVRNGLLRVWRWGRDHEVYSPSNNYQPVIRFVGVWDTVSAYGGPVSELTRAIDNWIWPLSMPNYELNDRVGCARHALALDDERDSFHPLLWDEVAERDRCEAAAREQAQGCAAAKAARARGDREGAAEFLKLAAAWGAQKRKYRDRLEQVWFTGMHADVGGGYPDESLSYVSLLWMIEEAERHGLRTLEVVTERYLALANSYGPSHDSRAGLGAYYRYQPRKIAAWLHPVDDRTLSLRDPIVTDADGNRKGLLLETRVHESVIARIATGTDKYAPLSLPRDFKIVPPGRLAEQQPQAVDGGALSARERARRRRIARPLLTKTLRERLADPTLAGQRSGALERLWNLIWVRRSAYFLTLVLTLLLVTMPLWIGRAPEPPLLADGRTWIGGVIRLLALLLPSFAGDWVEIYADNPFYFLLLGAAIGLLYIFSNWLERVLRDRTRRVWRLAVEDDRTPAVPPSRWRRVAQAVAGFTSTRLMRLRNSFAYQRGLQIFKWRVLPDVLFAPLLLAALAWFGLALFTQAAQPMLENGTELCKPTAAPLDDLTAVRRDFRANELCSDSLGGVRKGRRYVVTLDVVEPWYDGTLPGSPAGVPASAFPAGLGYLGVPFRRVVDASYLQPIFEIRPRRPGGLLGNVRIDPLEMSAEGDPPTVYRGEFVARKDGELFLFANDAMLPFRPGGLTGELDYSYFYQRSGNGPPSERGNRGTACLTVEATDVVGAAMGSPDPDSVCAVAAKRDAAAAAAPPVVGKKAPSAASGRTEKKR